MHRVVVVGAGPAGLAAAERLLHEGRGRFDVTVLTEKSYLGGKAASWDVGGGLVVENGQHVCLGFYQEMPALIGRSGVDFGATSVHGGGHFLVWEERDRETHHLHLGRSSVGTLLDGLRYTGWTLAEKAGFALFLARAMAEVVPFDVPEAWDDQCFTAWCLERGLPLSIFETSLYRASRDGQLNWPGEISAYSLLRTLKMAGRDYSTGLARYPAGGMSRIWWEPVGSRIQALGGRILRNHRLTRLDVRDGRLASLGVSRSLCPEHDDERRLGGGIPDACADGETPWTEVDAVILAIPPHALDHVLARTRGLQELPGLGDGRRLRPVVPLGLHIWHRERNRAPVQAVVLGMAPPLEFVVDNKPFYTEYRDRTDIGAALHFVGQQTAYEHLSDGDLLERAMTQVRRVRGFEHLDDGGILAWRVVRNAEKHQGYWNGEPGSLRYKPGPRTPVSGLWLAGDWIRNGYDFPSMETAVHSGRQTAGLLMEAMNRPAGPD